MRILTCSISLFSRIKSLFEMITLFREANRGHIQPFGIPRNPYYLQERISIEQVLQGLLQYQHWCICKSCAGQARTPNQPMIIQWTEASKSPCAKANAMYLHMNFSDCLLTRTTLQETSLDQLLGNSGYLLSLSPGQNHCFRDCLCRVNLCACNRTHKHQSQPCCS